MPYTSVQQRLWIPGTNHSIVIPAIVDPNSGTRWVFIAWNDGDTSLERIISNGMYTADYDTERLLTVTSAYGNPQGNGWYKNTASADFSITELVELPDTKYIFTGWSGDYSGDNAAASVVMTEPKTVTANWRSEFLLTVNSDFGSPTGAGWYRDGNTADFSVTDYIELSDTKHYFIGWSDDTTSSSAASSLVMSEPKVVTADWRHEYLLTVNSEYGQPTGAGWYQEGETASVFVAPVQGAIIRQIFDGWSGDLSDTQAASSLAINTPKVITATWHTDYMQLYLLIGGIVVLAGIIVTVVVLVRRRRVGV
jgi:uncharacterized repeat protein (TIGR02543 family)